jgi:uncharacterized protein
MSLTASEVIDLLKLEPLEIEGGFFREVWRSERQVSGELLGPSYGSDRSLGTAIYYLLTPDTVSALHSLPSEEIFHFYLGDPVRMLQLAPDGNGRVIQLGNDLAAGQQPMVVVPGGVWQGCHLIDGGEFALMGTTVAPGFDYLDFSLGNRHQLCEQYPGHQSLIALLTPQNF